MIAATKMVVRPTQELNFERIITEAHRQCERARFNCLTSQVLRNQSRMILKRARVLKTVRVTVNAFKNARS